MYLISIPGVYVNLFHPSGESFFTLDVSWAKDE